MWETTLTARTGVSLSIDFPPGVRPKRANQPPVAFAYPNGERTDYTPETESILGELSYDMAFTTEAGFASGARRLECPRFLMLAGVSAAELAHRLSYSWRREVSSLKSEV